MSSDARSGSPTADDWESHWGEYASSAQDNPAQRFRRRLVLDSLATGGSPNRVLDIGAGQGDLLATISARFPHATLAGVELSAAGVAEAAAKVPDADVVQCNLLVDTTPAKHLAGWATHAVCSEVLEHVDDPVQLLVAARSFLAPGCRLVVTVPGGPRSAFDVHIGHRRHFDRRAISDVLVRAGFVEVDAQATGFPVFNVYKLIVIARGKRVIEDVRGEPSGLAKIVMHVFDVAFRIAMRRGRLGWQIVATARTP